jgi:prevent-host-death family protein
MAARQRAALANPSCSIRNAGPAHMSIVCGINLLQSATGATMHRMKSRVITQRELRNDSGAILREVEAGRTVIVSRNGTPVGELRPIRRRRFVPRAAIADAAARAARIDAGQFRADLDAVVDPRAHG